MSYLLHDTQQSVLLLYTSASCLVTFSKNNGAFVMVTGNVLKDHEICYMHTESYMKLKLLQKSPLPTSY